MSIPFSLSLRKSLCTALSLSFAVEIYDNFHIFDQNIDCGYTLEPPQGDGSNEYPQSMF